jgi:hypothetical protein
VVRRPLPGACALQELVNANKNKLFPFHDSRVPHISLVFREMWDTANLDPVAPTRLDLKKTRVPRPRGIDRGGGTDAEARAR